MAEAKDMEGISQLPEPIIHHILSFLTTKEAAKTSLLSKSWLKRWRTRPTLELSYSNFFAKEASWQRKVFCWDNSEEEIVRSNEFSTYVKQVLERYREKNIVVDTFKLTLIYLFKDAKSLVKKCTKLALKYGVKNLDFFIPLSCGELPQIVLEAESLERLNIGNGKLGQQEIRCHRLKRLQLFRISLDEVMLEKVISHCPLIELLDISRCGDLKNIKVTKVHNLKRFVVDVFMYQRVEVEAPNLELLSCFNEEKYSGDERIPCWVTLHTPQYQNLKKLKLCGVGIYDNFFINFAHKFPHLEKLSIESCPDLQRIKLSSHSIKIIRMKGNLELKEAQFDVPSIVRFVYRSCNVKPPLLSFTAASGHWISDIYIHNCNDVETSWFLRLMGFLKNLIQSQISLRIDFKDCTVTFDIDEIKRSTVMLGIDEISSTVVEVQKLSLYFEGTKLPVEDTIVDVIFLICHPKTVEQYWLGNLEENKFVKSLYEMLMIRKNEEQLFNNLQQIKNWQHYLNGAEVKAFQDGVCVMARKVGQREQHPETMDWENLLNMLGNDENLFNMPKTDDMLKKTKICFMLEWKTPNICLGKQRD